MNDSTGAVPEGLEALGFLIGTWSGRGDGHFPTMDSFTYDEEIRFWHNGAPILVYVQLAWEPDTGELIHTETGIWRPVEDGRLAVTVALPRVAEVSEGTVHGTAIRLQSISMTRARGGAPLTQAHRTYDLNDGRLVYDVSMATEEVALSHHIHGTLTRV